MICQELGAWWWADPRASEHVNPTYLAQLVMQSIDVQAVKATERDLLEFLFEHADNETIKTTLQGRNLLRQLLDAKEQAESRVELLTKYAHKHKLEPPSISKDALEVQDSLIDLLKQQGIEEDIAQ